MELIWLMTEVEGRVRHGYKYAEGYIEEAPTGGTVMVVLHWYGINQIKLSLSTDFLNLSWFSLLQIYGISLKGFISQK